MFGGVNEMHLSKKDFDLLFSDLENPPSPNVKLKESLKRFKIGKTGNPPEPSIEKPR
jgi:uncharacterized protein (DUF1778 family)